MNDFAFAPLVDLPLVVVTSVAFIWHFNRWAFQSNIDTSVDVSSRLPIARLRVILLFASILLLCWTINFAAWLILALLLGIGLAVAMITGGGIDGIAFGLWASAYLIREWSFGFPQLVLHPHTHDFAVSASAKESGHLIGRTGVTTSPLRPTGDADIDGVVHSVASADGRLLDAGTSVTVTGFRNGLPCVTPMRVPNERGERNDVREP